MLIEGPGPPDPLLAPALMVSFVPQSSVVTSAFT